VQPCVKRAARAAAEAPELEEGQIRGCARWIAGRWPAVMQQCNRLFAGLENPAIANYG
jgi:hypothetical protein